MEFVCCLVALLDSRSFRDYYFAFVDTSLFYMFPLYAPCVYNTRNLCSFFRYAPGDLATPYFPNFRFVYYYKYFPCRDIYWLAPDFAFARSRKNYY